MLCFGQHKVASSVRLRDIREIEGQMAVSVVICYLASEKGPKFSVDSTWRRKRFPTAHSLIQCAREITREERQRFSKLQCERAAGPTFMCMARDKEPDFGFAGQLQDSPALFSSGWRIPGKCGPTVSLNPCGLRFVSTSRPLSAEPYMRLALKDPVRLVAPDGSHRHGPSSPSQFSLQALQECDGNNENATFTHF